MENSLSIHSEETGESVCRMTKKQKAYMSWYVVISNFWELQSNVEAMLMLFIYFFKSIYHVTFILDMYIWINVYKNYSGSRGHGSAVEKVIVFTFHLHF